MAKYDIDRFETPPDEDLICCICQCVLDNPLESPCRHVFCQVCIETWLTNRNNCPNCRKRLRVSKLKPVLPIVRNMINRLLIVCENREHGCSSGIKLEMYDRHVQNCDFAPIKCLNTGCGMTVLRKNMLEHEQNCKFRLIMCKKGCSLPISMEQLKKHNCIEELKKSMSAMEEQNKQHLCELETKLNTKIQGLEDRIKAMEENCHQDYTWGSASLGDFNDSDSQSRDMEYTDLQDYEETHSVDDDSNSFYYSGNEDEAFESSPEYQEAQTDGEAYSIFGVSHSSSDRGQGQEEHENDETGDIVVDDEQESESAFFLNTDAETNNESDGDLNDSLLDSSDGESEVDDPVEGDPVQVYEVSPTSPNAEHDEHEHRDTPVVSQSDDQNSDDVIHIDSANSPHSSIQADDTARTRTQSLQTVSSRGGHQDSTVSGRSSAQRTELSSLGSLNVEYGSSGRSSPHEADSVNLSDHDGDSMVVEVGSERGQNNEDGRYPRSRRGGQGVPTTQVGPQEREDSGERRHRSRDRSRSSSRQRHRSPRNSSSRDRHSQEREGSSSSRNRPSQNQPSASSADDPSRHTGTESSQGNRKERRKGRDFLYGVPIDDSDSNSDPPWERTSLDYSSDVTISDEFSTAYDSDDSSSDTYGKFLQSLHSISSSESDKTWAPGDPDDASLGSDHEELDYTEDFQAESERIEDDTQSPDEGSDDRHAGSRRPQKRELDSSQASHHSSPGRLDSRDEDQESGPSRERRNSDSDLARWSRDGDSRPSSRRGHRSDSSSESETEDDHHPAWKRRKLEDSSR